MSIQRATDNVQLSRLGDGLAFLATVGSTPVYMWNTNIPVRFGVATTR
jgi:hypothetical protein